MSTRPDVQTLHRLHDGELDPARRAETEARLDDEARARLAAIAEVGAVVRHAIAAEVDAAATPRLDGLWADIEKQIRPAQVISLRDRLLRGRLPVWISTAAAAAAALAVLVFAFRGPNGTTNGCDIDALEVSGAVVTIMKTDAVPGHGPATVVWLQEE